MLKDLLKISETGTGKVIIVAIVGVVLTVSSLMLLWNQEEARSERNFQIMREAIEQNDTSICNQIKGGTKKQVPVKSENVEIAARVIPARTEAEAKADCVSNVRRAQDLRNPD